MPVRPIVSKSRRTARPCLALTIALASGALALVGAAPSRAAVVRQDPGQKIFRSDLHPRLETFVYAPKSGNARVSPVIFFSGEAGWRPLQQDIASYLASTGRIVLGIDGRSYFDSIIPPKDLADDLAQFRAFVNERAGRPKEAPVILIGFSWGSEMVPYVLNRTGVRSVRGAVLIAPGRKGAARFRVGIQLKLDSPPGEGFSVEDELRRLPPIPIVVMKGTLDEDSDAEALAKVLRGPHKYVPVAGGDRQFHEVRDGFFAVLADALGWIDGPSTPPGR
jgi:pimeloyl-ACP methyl ester carboxylesterase